MTFEELQSQVNEWSVRNFGDGSCAYASQVHNPSGWTWALGPFLGVVEEVGELSHSLLKGSQGIRGTPTEHRDKIIDSIGDIVIFLADFCSRNGLDLDSIVANTWLTVSKRDWNANKVSG